MEMKVFQNENEINNFIFSEKSHNFYNVFERVTSFPQKFEDPSYVVRT